jgi:hypothetical protein
MVLGKPINSSADMAMVMRWVVERVDPNGDSHMRQAIRRLKMELQTPGSEPISYDSGSPDVPQGMAAKLAKSIQPMVGIEFLQTMSARGEIIDVRLSDEARQQLAQLPDGAQLEQLFSKEGIQSLLHQAATVLPAEPLKPGDRWTGTSRSQSPVGSLVLNNEYTYRGAVQVEGRTLDRIDVNMLVSVDTSQNNVLGVDIQITDQTNRGVMYFDAQAGRFADTVLNQEMTLVTKLGGQQHEQQLETKLRMRFADAKTSASRTASTESRPQGIGARK